MPRSQGTSRKGKPSKQDQAAGLGRALTKGRVAVRRDPRKCPTPGLVVASADADNNNNNNPSQQPNQHPRSVLEVPDLQDFLEQADLAQTEFVSHREGLVVLDATTTASNSNNNFNPNAAANAAMANDPSYVELSVPRRPAWDETTTKAELEQLERNTFYEWRRGIAVHEAAAWNNTANSTTTLYDADGGGPTPTATTTTTTTTPFEKNLDVWRQLWRVLERSSCLVQIVDARNPLFYVSTDLRNYASELPQHHNSSSTTNDTSNTEKKGKPMMVLVNKSDYLTPWQRAQWRHHLTTVAQWDTVLFFSASIEQAKLDAAAALARRQQEQHEQEQHQNNPDTTTKDSTMDSEDDDEDEDDDNANSHDDSESDADDDDAENNPADPDTPDLMSKFPRALPIVEEAEECPVDNAKESTPLSAIAVNASDNDIAMEEAGPDGDFEDVALLTRQELIDAMLAFAEQHNCERDPRYDNRIQFGMVGFPNVGKSSVINVLVGSSKHSHGLARVAVASQPGKTKHFQTLLLPDCDDAMMLCDCPGLVFPSLVSQTADLIAAGVYPIAQMRDYWPVMHLICQRIPRDILNAQYGIQLPVPGRQQLREQQRMVAPEMHESLVTHTTANVLLNTYCIARSLLSSFSGVPDHARAARKIVKDYATGTLVFCHSPPNGVNLTRWNAETRRTAIAQTKRLRDKAEALLGSDPATKNTIDESEKKSNDRSAVSTRMADEDDGVDMDLLALIGASAASSGDIISATGEKSHKKSNKKAGVTPKSKWGKKDRKNRNKDPYGCHSTPDGALYEEAVAAAASSGIVVNAGKYSQAGYTRPVTFPERKRTDLVQSPT